ncbi:MAG: hypothetical protein QOD57_507 [Actinomycetota bacterium]|nr:hypothetical protein [Actinomycetota bacterium]MDQ1498080.1 hypothetical protein [Actinomycetota bacterium]MDQ1502780.1 hypothetical protein [Actinomycetota bacterium]MDQ1566417.1 hypothetical protein [Actinomycetota bacterium]
MKPPELPLLHTLRSCGLDDLRHDATAAAVLRRFPAIDHRKDMERFPSPKEPLARS